jgi:Predicted pPIWI-associating nuclease
MTVKRKSAVSPEKARSIADAVSNTVLSETQSWSDLDVLSSNTHVEGIEVFEEEIRAAGGKFEGPINVHVMLNYSEGVTISETFPGRFEGTWEGDRPSIENVLIDTSSFYK